MGLKSGLSFNGVTERLGVPFAAVRRFADPSVNFDIRFAEAAEADKEELAPAKDAAPQALAAPERYREVKAGGGGKDGTGARRSRFARSLSQEVTPRQR